MQLNTRDELVKLLKMEIEKSFDEFFYLNNESDDLANILISKEVL